MHLASSYLKIGPMFILSFFTFLLGVYYLLLKYTVDQGYYYTDKVRLISSLQLTEQ